MVVVVVPIEVWWWHCVETVALAVVCRDITLVVVAMAKVVMVAIIEVNVLR